MSNLPTQLDHLARGLANTHARVKSTAGNEGEQYLKLAKSGMWVYGPDEIDVQENSAWAIDPNSFVQGYIAWEPDPNKPAEKLGEEMRPATDPPIQRADLPDVGGPWDEQLGMSLLCLTGEDKGTKVVYTTTSKGGVRAVNTILGEVVRQLQSGEADAIIPVVTLEVDSYQHKRYGKVYVPVLKLNRWEALSNSVEQASKTLEEPAAEEPAKEEEPKPEPSRRRRRRKAA